MAEDPFHSIGSVQLHPHICIFADHSDQDRAIWPRCEYAFLIRMKIDQSGTMGPHASLYKPASPLYSWSFTCYEL